MVKMRYEVLEQDTTGVTTLDTAIETINLPKTGILTELTIQARATNAFSDDICLPMWDILQEIKVLVNGSKVIKSYNGTLMRGLEWYNDGPFAMSYDYWSEDSSNARYNSFTIYFNRFHGDTAYGLDLAAYKSPQLKIDWNCDVTEVEGITYDKYGTPAFTYSVIAKIYEGSPAGFQNKYVKTSIIDQWTTAASNIHSTEIPLGFPLRGLMYRGAYVDINPEYTLENIKLDFDNGVWVPIDLDYAQFWNVFKSWYPLPVITGCTLRGKGEVEWNSQVYKIVSLAHSSQGHGVQSAGMTTSRRALGTMMWMDDDGTDVGEGRTTYISVMGWGPMQCLYIPMSQLTDGAAETIDTNAYGRIVLQCTSGASSGTAGDQYIVGEYDIPNGQ